MKRVILEEVRRIFQLMNHGNTNKIDESIIAENYFSQYYSCVTSFPQTKSSTGIISGGVGSTQNYGVIFAEPKNIKQLEGLSFSNGGEVYRYGYMKGTYYCRGNTIVYTIDGKENTYTPKVTPKVNPNDPKVLPTVTIVGFPKCLKNTAGVKDFQDWLDTNKKGWLKGKELNKQGGYGRYGPNTQSAYKKYGKEYCNGKTQPHQITKVTSDVDRTELTTPTTTTTLMPKLPQNLTAPSISGQDLYTTLLNNGNIEGDGRRRIKLKIGSIPDDSLQKLDDYLATMNYTRIKQKENMKQYGSKYVWLKTN